LLLPFASRFWLLLTLWFALDALFLYTYTSTLLLFLQIQDSEANSRWRSRFQALFEVTLKSTLTFSIISFNQQNYNNYPSWNYFFLSFFLCLFFRVKIRFILLLSIRIKP
jgi:hypothetical protein